MVGVFEFPSTIILLHISRLIQVDIFKIYQSMMPVQFTVIFFPLGSSGIAVRVPPQTHPLSSAVISVRDKIPSAAQ